MKEQKRIQLTHGTARVDVDCPQKTIDTLNEMCNLLYDMNDIAKCTNEVCIMGNLCYRRNKTVMDEKTQWYADFEPKNNTPNKFECENLIKK